MLPTVGRFVIQNPGRLVKGPDYQTFQSLLSSGVPNFLQFVLHFVELGDGHCCFLASLTLYSGNGLGTDRTTKREHGLERND